jgi:hypothetical protein
LFASLKATNNIAQGEMSKTNATLRFVNQIFPTLKVSNIRRELCRSLSASGRLTDSDVGFSLISFALPYAILSVAFGDKN